MDQADAIGARGSVTRAVRGRTGVRWYVCMVRGAEGLQGAVNDYRVNVGAPERVGQCIYIIT